MSGTNVIGSALGTLRRQWIVVVVALVIAVGAGFVISADVQDVYSANAYIEVDTSGRAQYVAKPDTIIRYASSGDVRESVAEATDLTEDEVAAALRAVGPGNPVTRIVVTFSADTEERAETGASAAAQALIERHLELAETEIAYRQSRVDLTQEAIDAYEAADVDASAYEQLTLDVNLNGKRLNLVDFQNNLYRTQNVFAWDGEVSSSLETAGSARAANLVGAGIAGLILGILLAAAREAMTRSDSTA